MSEEHSENLLERASAILHSTNNHLKRVVWLLETVLELVDSCDPETKLDKGKAKLSVVVPEILRGEVVLLHAILEDGLREILRLKLEMASLETLDEIPLVGTSKSGQPKKFGLGELSRHRSKTVDEVIQESVDDFLDKTSFTSTRTIAGHLQSVGIDTHKVDKYFPSLDQMITRRHQIVHRADRVGDVRDFSVPSVNPDDVGNWLITVFTFTVDLLFLAFPEIKEAIEAEIDGDEVFRGMLDSMRQLLDGGDQSAPALTVVP